MSTFANAVINQEARTENGMKARKSTASAVTDLFFKIGAMRGQDPIPTFLASFVADQDVAIRTALWARDVRGGAGERESFRKILAYLAQYEPEISSKVLLKVPEVGRWDDLFAFEGTSLEAEAFDLIKSALDNGNGLAAKWMPRKGFLAHKMRMHFGWTPKFYRKRLVELTKVVETQMCANQWDNINFNHVPSLASSRYKKAFYKHTPKFAEYVAALVRGDEGVKVNTGAVYPYDVLKGLISKYDDPSFDKVSLDHIKAQWDALPNFVGDANILPLIDVSGSMECAAGKKGSVTCLEVAVSLGLYCADKNKGKFKDMFLTFSELPKLVNLSGNILSKTNQIVKSSWGYNTDLHAAFDKILKTALDGNVPQEEMPDVLLIMSDMQFDCCGGFDDSAYQMIQRKYQAAGYKTPNVVFWNLNAHDNVPVHFKTEGVALVSGFSPAILKSILSGNLGDMTPESIMLKTVMADRYSWQ